MVRKKINPIIILGYLDDDPIDDLAPLQSSVYRFYSVMDCRYLVSYQNHLYIV